MTNYQQKITFGELRAAGVRDVLVYCRTIVAAMSKSPPMAGLTTSVCRTSSQASSVPPAASAARRCGRSFRSPACVLVKGI
jgi:hypothetical protein